MLVDFTKIVQHEVSNSLPVLEVNSVNVYDPLWGYYTAGQELSFSYNDSGYSYNSEGTVNIDGTFTIGAEESGDFSGMTDEQKFGVLKQKYDTLSQTFITAAKSIPPSGLLNYGTADDHRCVALPSQLVDSNSNTVYMRPFSLNIIETQWPIKISYKAVLKEVKQPDCKLLINGGIIDDGTIVIVPRKPRLTVEKFAFSHGGEIFFSGWEPRSFGISGYVSETVADEGSFINSAGVSMFNLLVGGSVDVSLLVGSDVQSLYSGLSVTNSDMEFSTDVKGYKISIGAKD